MFDLEPAYNPHRALWQAVLTQAYEDAMNGVPGLKVQRLARIRQTQEARDYLTTPSADLAEVCGNIGLDMDAIIYRMKVKLATAPSAEQLINGRSKWDGVEPKPKPKRIGPAHNAKRYLFAGANLTLKEWSGLTGIKVQTLKLRLKTGATIAVALTTPLRITSPVDPEKNDLSTSRPTVHCPYLEPPHTSDAPFF